MPSEMKAFRGTGGVEKRALRTYDRKRWLLLKVPNHACMRNFDFFSS